MKPKCNDETRWMARLIAVYMFVFVVNGLIVNLSAVFNTSAGSAQSVRPVVGLVLGGVFFWLAFRLLVCSSLWNLLGFLKEKPLFAYIQCRYFSINQHIRSGLTGMTMLFLIAYPLPGMIRMSEGSWFSVVPKSLYAIVFWPVRAFLEIFGFQPESRGLLFAMLLVYIVGTRFIAGAGISLISSRLADVPSTPDKSELRI